MSIIDTAKDVYELAKKGATLELQEQLIKMREEALALQQENLALKTRIKELEEARAIQESLSFDGTVYWKHLPDGEKEGPYCQRCYDVESRLVRLQSHWYTFEGRRHDSWQCKACDKSYEDNTH